MNNQSKEIMDALNLLLKQVSSYSKSLDSLVPVWEKIGLLGDIEFNLKGTIGVQASSIQEAACLATAQAVLELKENNDK